MSSAFRSPSNLWPSSAVSGELALAWQASWLMVRRVANNPTVFSRLMREVYGTAGLAPAGQDRAIEALRLRLRAGDRFGVQLRIVDEVGMGGASAAFSRAGMEGESPKIFVNAALLSGTVDSRRLRRVLLEEIGHLLEHQLNPTAGYDTAGDEGELFSSLVSGKKISSAERSRIAGEEDRASITVDGQEVVVEASGTSGVGRVLYLSTDGTDNDGSGSLDLSDPVSTGDTSTSTTAAITPASVTTGAAVTTTNANGSGYSYEIKSGQVAGQSFTIAGSGTYVPSALLLAIARETTENGARDLPIKVEIATAASGGTVLFDWSGTGATFPQSASKDSLDNRTSVTLTRKNNSTLTFGTQYFIRVSSTGSFGKVYWSGSGSNLAGLPAGNTFENGSGQSSKDFEYQLTYAPITITPAVTASFTQTVSFDGSLVIPSGGQIRVVTHIREATGLTGDLSGVKATLSYGSGTTLLALSIPTYDATASTLTWTGTVASGLSLASNTSLNLVVANDKSGSSFKVNYDSTAAPSRIEFPNNAPVLDLDASNPPTSTAQTSSLTFAASYDAGDVVSLAVDGATYSHTVVTSGRTAENVYDALKLVSVSGVTLANSLTAKGVSWAADLSSNSVTLTGNAGAANAFTVSSAINNDNDLGVGTYRLTWSSTSNFTSTERITILLNGTSYESGTSSLTGSGARFDAAAQTLVTTLSNAGFSTTYDTSSDHFDIIFSSSAAFTLGSGAGQISGSAPSGSSSTSTTNATLSTPAGGAFAGPSNQAAPTVSTTSAAVDGGTGFAGSFTQGAGAIAVVANSIGITDLDQSTIQSATFVLSNRLNGSAESLSVSGSLPTGITATAYDSSTGTLTLSGSATLAAYQSALQAIRYNNTAGTLNTTSRVINITVSDGSSSNVAVSTISMVATADSTAPTLAITSDKASLKAGETATITFTFSEAPTGFADGDITVSGGTLSAISGTGLTRTATFTPTASSSGTASITVAAGS